MQMNAGQYASRIEKLDEYREEIKQQIFIISVDYELTQFTRAFLPPSSLAFFSFQSCFARSMAHVLRLLVAIFQYN